MLASRAALRLVPLAVLAAALVPSVIVGSAARASTSAPVKPVTVIASTPIQHVVVIDMENHSFDNVLGLLCISDQRCNGADTGVISTGQTIPLSIASDIPPQVAHNHGPQVVAVDGGKMDHFDLLSGCGAPKYACLSQYQPSQIPNLAALVRAFAISDATYQLDLTASWGGHLELVTSTIDGFTGDNPVNPPAGVKAGSGWGCDSHRRAAWQSQPGAKVQLVPSCIPMQNGTGAYTKTPVKWVPTLMDEMYSAGLSISIDVGDPPSGTAGFQSSGYQWALCPTFADCIDTPEHNDLHLASQVLTDAKNGTLPAVSLVTPDFAHSQHNGRSMLEGDNWLGSVVSALENGPEWLSTAVFITYDDCGCFYDHVTPPSPAYGPRVPLVIVSPYAIAGYTDHTTATQAGILAYIEHTFGLSALGTSDATAYDFSNAFNYSQTPLGPVQMRQSVIPLSSTLDAQPADPDDPT